MFRLIRYVIFAALAFMVAVWISGQSRADAGIERIIVVDPVSGVQAPTVVVYPTDAEANQITLGPYNIQALRGAVPAESARGLILVSHGAGASALAHISAAVALAEAGFVVAAPQHPGDNFTDFTRQGTWQVYAGRPKTLSAVIDALSADDRFAGMLEGKPVGAFGLSMGGYTVLALAGAQPSLARLGEFCARHATDAACVLGISRPSRHQRDRPLAALADPRVGAALVMAPATAMFATDGLAGIGIPVRFYTAGRDGIVHPDLHAEPFRSHFPAAFEYVRVEDAGHLSFATPLPPDIVRLLPPYLHDPPGFDRAAFQARLDAEIVAFFTRTLR